MEWVGWVGGGYGGTSTAEVCRGGGMSGEGRYGSVGRWWKWVLSCCCCCFEDVQDAGFAVRSG